MNEPPTKSDGENLSEKMTSTSDSEQAVRGCIALAEIRGAPDLLLSPEDIQLMKQTHDEKLKAFCASSIRLEARQLADRTDEGQKKVMRFMRTQFNLSQLRGKRRRDSDSGVREKIDAMKTQLENAFRGHYNILGETELTVDSYLFCVQRGAKAQEWHVDAPNRKHYWTVMFPLGDPVPDQGTTEFEGQETPPGAYFFSGKTKHRGGANNSKVPRWVFSLVMYTGKDPNNE